MRLSAKKAAHHFSQLVPRCRKSGKRRPFSWSRLAGTTRRDLYQVTVIAKLLYILHPEAYTDIDGLWEFTAKDNLDAADRVREEIYETIRALVAFPHQGHRRPSLPAPCDS